MISTSVIFLLILSAIVAVALAFGQYYFTKRQKRWWLFASLRFLTYFAVFLLLINPEFKQEAYTTEKPSLVLAVDNSSSIAEFEQENNVQSLVENLQKNKDLNDKFSVETYTFGEDLKRSDSLTFKENKTHISAVFSNLQKLYKKQTSPTVLITDGNQTYGRDYEFLAQEYEQEIFPVVVGDTTKHEDLQINRINVNRYAFLNNKFPVEVFVNYDGTKNHRKIFTIKEGNHTVYTEEVEFNEHENAVIVEAELKAENVGVHTYTAEIESLENEKNTENNQQNFAVEVVDQKTNVLILSALPHPDLGMFKKSIEQNQQREAEIKYTDDENIDFGKYQLVIFYQPNPTFKRAYEQAEHLELNSFTVTGTKTDFRFLNEQQDFIQKEITNQTEHYLPIYNSGYADFQFEDIGFDDFPPLEDEFGEVQITQDYQTLLYQNINGYETENPLLFTVNQGQNKHGFLLGENSWRWRGKSFVKEDSFEKFDEFFGKIIQFLASNKRKERLSVEYESFYNSGDRIIFQAHYFDENYEFDPRGKLSIQVKNKETEETEQFPFLLKNNNYEVNLSSLRAGEYDFTVQVDGENLKDSGEFTIVDFDIEKQFLNADVDKLKRISESLYFTDKEEELVNDLLKNDDFKVIQKSKTVTSTLIDWWYLLLIIVLSLSVEWFMRKYRGLI